MATRRVSLAPTRKGQRKITFRQGSLHAQLGVPQGKKIPASKMAAARAGRYGSLAKRRALFAQNVLTGRRRGR